MTIQRYSVAVFNFLLTSIIISLLRLTAFVTRLMCQAARYTSIDNSVIKAGLMWLIDEPKQRGYAYQWPLVDASISGDFERGVSKLAFVLRGFSECVDSWTRTDLASKTLGMVWDAYSIYKNGLLHINPHGGALMVYSLLRMQVQWPEGSASTLVCKLFDDPVNNTRNAGRQASPLLIESTGYFLLYQLACNNSDAGTVQALANWLELHRPATVTPTHHSVVALEALTQFALMCQQPEMDLTCNVTLRGQRGFEKIIRLKSGSAATPPQLEVRDLTGNLLVTTNGTGSGLLSVKFKYNVPQPLEPACKHNVSVRANIRKPLRRNDELSDFPEELLRELYGEHMVRRSTRFYRSFQESANSTASDSRSPQQSKLTYDVEVCAQYLGESDSNVTVIEVGLLSGFSAVKTDMKAVRIENDFLTNYVVTDKNVILYFHHVPREYPTCLKFATEREHIVHNIQSAVVKVYDFYDPACSCTQVYGLDSTSPIFKLPCQEDECRCFEDVCPPKRPFLSLRSLRGTKQRRQKMLDLACNEHDFVWIATVSRSNATDTYRHIEVRVDAVIKEGAEKRESALTGTKLFIAHAHCNAADLNEGGRYFILGRDGELVMKNGVVEVLYALDKHVRLFDIEKAPSSKMGKSIRSILSWLEVYLRRQKSCPK